MVRQPSVRHFRELSQRIWVREIRSLRGLAFAFLAGKTRGRVVIDLRKLISAVRVPECQCTSAPPPQLFSVES
jgi:hypothetical protein